MSNTTEQHPPPIGDQCLDLNNVLKDIMLSQDRIKELVLLFENLVIHPTDGSFIPLSSDQIKGFINDITSPGNWPEVIKIEETVASVVFTNQRGVSIVLNLSMIDGELNIVNIIAPDDLANPLVTTLDYDQTIASLINSGYSFDYINFEVFTNRELNGYKLRLDIGYGHFQYLVQINLSKITSTFDTNGDVIEIFTETLSLQILPISRDQGTIETRITYTLTADTFNARQGTDLETSDTDVLNATLQTFECRGVTFVLPDGYRVLTFDGTNDGTKTVYILDNKGKYVVQFTIPSGT
jgi:hypothetical protein